MTLIEDMLSLQKMLNNKTNGNHWSKGHTKEGREINWNRCIYMESVEAIDSFNWKHWKDINAPDDWDNLKVELIDIWHFLMSEMLRLNQVKVPEQKVVLLDQTALITSLEKLTKAAVNASLNKDNNKENLTLMINIFFDCLSHAGIDIKELYRCYVVKNQLNIFRQNHGYKEGSYKKMWHGKEDNVVAFELMQGNPLNPEQLYQSLEDAYQNL